MNKIKEFLKVLIYPIILLLIQFGLIIIFTLVFNINNNNEIGSLEYTEQLSIFLSSNKIWISLLSLILLIPLFRKKCTINNIKCNIKHVLLLIGIGASFSLTYNLILLNINKIIYFTNIFDHSDINLLSTLLATSIIGPIIEELIFRNIVYEKFKKVYKPLTSIIITGLLFGIFHGNMIQFIYVFLFNFILIFVYEKYKSIYAPIIVHISANSILLLYLRFIDYSNIYVSVSSLLISVIFLIIFYYLMNKDKSNG